jgi:hypothetical protein
LVSGDGGQSAEPDPSTIREALMIQPVAPFEEPWPNDEMQMVVDAVHAAVAARARWPVTADTGPADGQWFPASTVASSRLRSPKPAEDGRSPTGRRR